MAARSNASTFINKSLLLLNIVSLLLFKLSQQRVRPNFTYEFSNIKKHVWQIFIKSEKTILCFFPIWIALNMSYFHLYIIWIWISICGEKGTKQRKLSNNLKSANLVSNMILGLNIFSMHFDMMRFYPILYSFYCMSESVLNHYFQLFFTKNVIYIGML